MASNRYTGVLLVMTAALVASIAPGPASAHPENTTDHGLSNETFHRLWAGDQDNVPSRVTQSNGSAIEQLTNGTDVLFNAPPQAVAQWNRGDHREFPATNRSVSIHPPNATLTGGRYIQAAYAEVFAVQPSTRARLAPGRQPWYVAPTGTVRGTVDYRVAVPAGTTTGSRAVSWQLQQATITETALFVDGQQVTTGNGSHTPALSYRLAGAAGTTHRLTLQANISVRLQKQTTRCSARNQSGGCTTQKRTVTNRTENLTVSDPIRVTTYDLTVSGFQGRYPNGDLGLVVYKNQPWLGYELPNGAVHGVWRFYVARNPGWDSLVYSSGGGQRTSHSPLHPLQVTAVPVQTGPTPSPRRNVTLLDVYGTMTPSPSLPPAVTLDTPNGSYTASYGIATRTATNGSLAATQAWGLVRGVTANHSSASFARIPIHRSNLTLTVRNQTADTVTVRVRLRNASSGGPINTAGRDGYIVVNGQRVNTTGNGTVTLSISRPPGGVSARYEPGKWWRHASGFTADSATVFLQGTVLQWVAALFRAGVPVALFLLAVFMIDRITGWRVWPPWRQL